MILLVYQVIEPTRPPESKTMEQTIPPCRSSAIDDTLLRPSKSQQEISVHHWRSTYLRQFTHLRTTSLYPISDLKPNAIIGWLWRIVDARHCLFHHLWCNFFINSRHCPIRNILGWLSRRVYPPTVIPPEMLIHFDMSTDAITFSIQIKGVLCNPLMILDYGVFNSPFLWFWIPGVFL